MRLESAKSHQGPGVHYDHAKKGGCVHASDLCGAGEVLSQRWEGPCITDCSGGDLVNMAVAPQAR
jgi:hypothetical protein